MVSSFDPRPANRVLDLLSEGPSRAKARELLRDRTIRRMPEQFGLRLDRAASCLCAASADETAGRRSPTEGRFIAHLATMLKTADELKAFLAGLQREEQRILEAAFSRTRDYLPRGASSPGATVVFLPIGYDARVDRRTVYFDPVLAGIVGREGVVKLLSHELHHVARFELTGEAISGMGLALEPWLADRDGLVRLWATLLEMEGIADCIFALSEFDLPLHRRMISERKRVYREYAEQVSRVQKLLLRERGKKISLRFRRRVLAPLVLEHIHPVGARLAHEILNGLGRAKLVECVGRPELFLLRYQEAAGKKRLLRLDEGLLARLSRA
jgi:Putative zinc dependent peptidase (DUF5700)